MTKIEDFVPLSPMQEGMLFHTLYAPEAGEYFKRVSCVLEGRLKVAAFKTAWERVVERHPALRASFVWEGVERPIQVVHSSVGLPWLELDWRGLRPAEQQLELQRFLQRDSTQTFKLNKPPLMRFALMQTADEMQRFVWSFHHLLLDGWSIPLILKEVFATHDVEGRIEDLHLETPRPYRDYIAWLHRQDLAAAERFWKQYLKGFTTPTKIGLDRRLSGGEAARYASLHSTISPSKTAQISSFARNAKVTISSLARGAWAVLLSRYSGKSDVVFGATVSGRPLELSGVESMVGLFINTLPIRVNVGTTESLSDFLLQVHAQQADLREYEHSPLAEIQKWSDAPRGQPLFESLLVFENYPDMDFVQQHDQSICIKDVESVERTSYPLTLLVSPGRELRLSLHYDTRRFDADAMARLMKHFKTLLEEMSSDQPIHALPMIGAEERRTLIHRWNDTRADYPEMPVYRLIEDRAIEIPDRVAVIYEERQLTYAELNRLANQLAHYLRRRGVRPGSLVGICVERSLEMVIGLLGIMKACGAYVPFDPGYPKDRLTFMLKDAQAPLVLTQEHLLSVLPEDGTQVVCLDRDWREIADCAGENSEHGATLNDLAYVIYTSGSTGLPKGAMNTHRGLSNRLCWMQQRYGLETDDRILQKTPISFDVSVWEFFWPLLAGATLIVARPGGHQDPSYLVKVIRSQRITTLHFVPSMLKVFLQEPGVEQCDSLRRVICSGEALSHDLEQQFLAQQHAELHNLYGPTEASIDVTSWQCIRGDTSPSVPIGRPIANTQIYILDRSMNVAPIGVAGELYIGGVGVGKGYWNRPELTKERFIRDLFSTDPAARLYRTGDLARYREDGAIEFLGRMDHQIKIRGLRVELGEIESTLLLDPRVREAVVVAREYEVHDLRLVAYYVSSDGPIPPEQLREYVGQRLPDYMVPAAFVRLDSMPLSANGKLNRDELPMPEFAGSTAQKSALPRSTTEDVISAIWMDVLKIKEVGVHDNFFELGGHSLLAMQIASRVTQTCKVDVSVKTILESPTVARLARDVEAAREAGDGVPVDCIKPVRHDFALPLSFAQQRLWFLHQMEPNLSTYILPLALRLRGNLQLDALKTSLREVVSRHASLRTRFTTIDGTPMQCIEAEMSLEITVRDLSANPETVRELEASRLALEDAERPFDLTKGPSIRASVVRMSERDHIVLVSMHHISSDDWSIGVFLRELTALYEAFCAGKPSPLPALSIQYADFGQWQHDWLQGEVLDKKLAYWKKTLAGPLPVLDLPTDRPRPAIQSFHGAREPLLLRAAIVASLKSLSFKESATLFMALLTSLSCLLHRYSRQKDIIVGSPVAGRTRIETENLIGFFVNTLPLRCDLSGDPSFRELLNRVREVTLGAYAHQDLPFEILVDEVQPERDLSRTPIYQVMLAPQSNSLNDLKLRDVEVTPLEIDSRMSKFDLTFYVWEYRGEVHGRVEYNTDLWDAATIKCLIVHFECLLEAAVANPDLRISQLPMLNEEQRRQMLVEWNHTQSHDVAEICVAQLFEAQTRENPEQLAVSSPNARLTYRELNQKANQLGRYLKECRVGPEVLVGVFMERSVEMVIGLLAVLKAGGAYVPLDRAYPADRLAFMLEDARAPVLLTQQELLRELPETTAKVICVDNEQGEIAGQSGDNLTPSAQPNNLAYVIYTSGSTGRPKGVAIEHHGLLNLIRWHQHTYEVSEKDRATQLAAQAFDASVWELWPYLTAGASIHIPDEETRSSPAALMQWMAEKRITFAFLPTPLAEAALELELPRNLCLKALLTGGDRLHRAPQRELPFRLMNHYGPTENTVVATYCEVRPYEKGVPPIGRPISNTQVYVLDEGMQPVPVGVAGELYIGGESLARGYHCRPELTAQKFVTNPFCRETGVRLYKTGDLVRYRADGAIDFLGRVDGQVKIRGFRIELGEIENVLAKHHLVRDCVVVAREELPGQKRLVGYVAIDPRRSPSQEEFRAFLSEHLPSYMVPMHFVLLHSLPLTANGKVDVEALPAPEIKSAMIDHAKPRTPVEEALAQIWSQVLTRPRIGIHDNFFEHGGDSILSIRVAAKAHQQGIQISPKDIFQHQTIAELASVAKRLPLWAGEPAEVTGPAPLTPIQQWFFQQEFVCPDHFNQAMLLEVHRRLEPSTLEQAVRHWTSSHDALRLRFTETNGTWRQFCTEGEDENPISFHDLSKVSPNERAQAVEKIATDLQQSLNLSKGPLLRVAWFDLGADQPARLLITIHHLVVDAVSWRILLDDFVDFCEKCSEGKDRKPRKGISFTRWAEHLTELAPDQAFVNERAYWTQALSRNFAPLPVDYAVNAYNTVRSASTIRANLDTAETRRLLEEAPSAHRATINELLLTALFKTLGDWTGSTSLLLDMEGHGREEITAGFDTSRTVGWFTTIFPVALDVQINASLLEILRRVKERVRSISHHGFGYGVLRYLSDDATRRHVEDLPRGQLLFNYLGRFDRAWPSSWLSLARESSGPLHSPENHRPYLLELSGGVHDGRLLMEWSYSEHIHRRQTIEDLAHRFIGILCGLSSCQAESSAVSPSDFSAARMSQADLDKLFTKINLPAERRPQ